MRGTVQLLHLLQFLSFLQGCVFSVLHIVQHTPTVFPTNIPTVFLLFKNQCLVWRRMEQWQTLSLFCVSSSSSRVAGVTFHVSHCESKESRPTRWWRRICCQSKMQKPPFWQYFRFKRTANREPSKANEGKGVGYFTEKLEVCTCSHLQPFYRSISDWK